MTDEERFNVVLGALGDLIVALRSIGLDGDVVLIGAQVVAIEQRDRGRDIFSVEAPHQLKLTRGFSFEPDLVLDTDDEQKLEHLNEVLTQQGFARLWRRGRPATWSKAVGEVDVEVDLFTTSAERPTPGALTPLRGAPHLRSRLVALLDGQSIRVPDACSFLSMKLEARRLRPERDKDSFDLFAYVNTVGPKAIDAALGEAGPDGARVRRELGEIFGSLDGPGVQDVLKAGLPHASDEERALLARFVVDTFAEI